MPKRAPHDENFLEIGLFGHLAYEGCFCPDGIRIEVILDDWFVEHERDLAATISERSLDTDAPLRHPDGDDEEICVPSGEAVDEHVREVEKDLY